MTSYHRLLHHGADFRVIRRDPSTGAHKIDWCKPIAQPGYPWASGVLYLEHRDGLDPLEARGYAGPGKFHRIQYLPVVQQALYQPVKALSNVPLRIERPELPGWMSPAERAVALRHWRLCERVWYEVTKSRKALAKFVREAILGAAVDGFYLGELICDQRTWDFEGVPFSYWVPRLPEKRAAWTVRYWLTQREKPVGAILDASRATDYGGGTGPAWAVVPWRKLIHVAADQQGSNLEGVSWLRPIFNIITMLQETYRIEALATEVNGLGELHFVLPQDVESTVKGTMATHLRDRKAGQAPGGVWPHGTEIEVISPQSTLPDFGPIKESHRRDIQLQLDATDAEMGQREVGSYAARKEASAERWKSYEYIAQQYVANPLEDLLQRAISINYPGDVARGMCYTPAVAFGRVDERDNEEWLAAVALTAQIPDLLTPEDKAGIRKVLVEDVLKLPRAGDVGEGGEDLVDEDAVDPT